MIAIGITTAGQIKSQTVFSLARMIKGEFYEVLIKEGPNQPLNREVIAETALQLNCSHLLFIDSDMTFEKDALKRLLERNKDIIGVNYNMRKFPLTSTVQGEIKGDLFRCNGVATGFMLIKTEIFKKLKKPWFYVGMRHGDIEGHDYRFCRLAREAGYEVWCDNEIKIGHIGDYTF